eukprot:Ihof_evm6s137 gene=Ihof_evmTU6s137
MVTVQAHSQTLSVFSLPQRVINGCVVANSGTDTGNMDDVSQEFSGSPSPLMTCSKGLEGLEEGYTCLSCSLSFNLLEDQRQHFKLDWHRANVRARAKGMKIMTEEEFEEQMEDLSSISGSDSDLSDHAIESKAIGHEWVVPVPGGDDPTSRTVTSPKIMFTNPDGDTFYIWRVVLQANKHDECDFLTRLRQLPRKQKWAIFMCSGGHFAGAIFDGPRVTHHKTIHRYVVRKKNGTIQSLKDGASGGSAPKSAGASIRRHNETMLAEGIYQLLTKDWKDVLARCDLIFVGAPSVNAKYFFGGGKKDEGAFTKADHRLRPIPFTTRRPVFAEVRRVHSILSGAHHVRRSTPGLSPTNETPLLTAFLLNQLEPTNRTTMGSTHTSIRTVIASDTTTDREVDSIYSDGTTARTIPLSESLADLHIAEGKEKDSVYMACEAGDLTALQEGLRVGSQSNREDEGEGRKEEIEGMILSKDQGQEAEGSQLVDELYEPDGWSLLHCAAHHGHVTIVGWLMEVGADPTIRDLRGRVPYLVSKDKDTRDAFRRYMGLRPDQWDYSKAFIPSPLTPEIEAGKAEREERAKIKAEKLRIKRKKEQEKKKEKKKAEKELQIAEDLKKKEEEKAEAARAAIKNKERTLTDREKRALAAEKRQKVITSQKREQAIKNSLNGRTPPPGGCFNCGRDMKDITPFDRLTYRYCCMECLI